MDVAKITACMKHTRHTIMELPSNAMASAASTALQMKHFVTTDWMQMAAGWETRVKAVRAGFRYYTCT